MPLVRWHAHQQMHAWHKLDIACLLQHVLHACHKGCQGIFQAQRVESPPRPAVPQSRSQDFREMYGHAVRTYEPVRSTPASSYRPRHLQPHQRDTSFDFPVPDLQHDHSFGLGRPQAECLLHAIRLCFCRQFMAAFTCNHAILHSNQA